MMGLRPSTTGIYAIQPWFRTVPEYADWVTLPQYFMQNDYNVVATGKIYHDAYPPKESRRDGVEFSVWGLHGKFNWPEERIATPFTRVPLVDWGVWPERNEDVFDYDVAFWTVEYLRDAPEDQPLFLNVGIRHPHLPLFAPQEWFDLYPETADVLPPVLENDRDDVPDFAWYLHWRLAEPRLAWVKEHDESLLEDPDAPRTVPAITTQGEGNHAIRSERYRYIRYGDGSEELYDMAQDPNEWSNLADKPEYAAIVAEHKQWLPETNAEPVPGSKTRLLEKRDDGWYWELQKIEGPVPMEDPHLGRR